MNSSVMCIASNDTSDVKMIIKLLFGKIEKFIIFEMLPSAIHLSLDQ